MKALSSPVFYKEEPFPGAAAGKTVQEYIDETPFWSDGTESPSIPMTRMQWWIWLLATAGKFFEGMIVFMIGVALPLIVQEFGLSAVEKGAVSAAPLLGILVGASALGGLADLLGRKRMFIVEMILFAISLSCLVLSSSFEWLMVFLFGVGAALGCDYPTAHMIISESIPTGERGKLVLGAFGFQAVGAIAGASVGYLVLYGNPQLGAWRWMFATAIIPAILVVFGRFFIPDSGHWLVSRGRMKDAEREIQKLLRRRPPYPKRISLVDPRAESGKKRGSKPSTGYGALFSRKLRRNTILASVPWFLQDLGTYGIGIFTPTILATVIGAKIMRPHNIAAVTHDAMQAAKGAAFIDVFLLIGVCFAILLADKVGRIGLQVFGFIGCAVGLFLASLSVGMNGKVETFFIFAGFMLFNFMTNMGPNAMTYLIAGEVFPTRIRGAGAGFAASFAKIGAVLTAFLFPVLLKDIGTQTLLYILVGTSLLGAFVTWVFRVETKGVSLEKVGDE